MTNSDVLRSLRYLLNISETKLLEIAELGGCLVTPQEISTFLLHDDEPGYEPCPHEVLGCFLNGLVIFKRGADPTRPKLPLELPVSNNLVLKKLRVAFELKDTDIIRLVGKSGFEISKSEIAAFCRSRDHRNYRECGDQFLRYLLKGLAL